MSEYTEEQAQALRDAIAAGLTSVRYGDREAHYASLTELRAALAEIERSLAAAAGTTSVRRVNVFPSGGW